MPKYMKSSDFKFPLVVCVTGILLMNISAKVEMSLQSYCGLWIQALASTGSCSQGMQLSTLEQIMNFHVANIVSGCSGLDFSMTNSHAPLLKLNYFANYIIGHWSPLNYSYICSCVVAEWMKLMSTLCKCEINKASNGPPKHSEQVISLSDSDHTAAVI